MIFENEQAVIDYIKANQKEPDWITTARKYTEELKALVDGTKFVDILIDRIEKIESTQRAAIRKRYSRSVQDLFMRLFLPIENVFSSTGGIKNYKNGEYQLSDDNLAKLLSFVSNTRDGKSIERYLEDQWMDLYHCDPAGVQWINYTTDATGLTSMYPTYWCIDTIRNYIPKGQLVECIVFEPTKLKDGSYVWTVVDDLTQYSIIQKGNDFTPNPDSTKTFQHPFGVCPVIINSNIIGNNATPTSPATRLSPIHNVIPLVKEYARDQSVKSIFKCLAGFPIQWKMDKPCLSCNGSKKNGTGDGPCELCSGTGWFNGKADVSDEITIAAPDGDTPPIDPKMIAGFSSPDLDTWKQFNEELRFLEDKIVNSYWGIEEKEKVTKTATEIVYDAQPKINKLTKYATTTEWLEWKITELYANAIDTAKPKDQSITLIIYGNHFILEGVDEILEKYFNAKSNGAPIVVLDAIWDELMTVKFKNDLEWMSIEKNKSRCEPYLHFSFEETNTFFGNKGIAFKAFFRDWWNDLEDKDLQKDVKVLKQTLATDFKTYWKEESPPPPPPAQVVVPPANQTEQ